MRHSRRPAVSKHTAALSRYIAGAIRRPLPAAVAECARHHLVDTISAMVSGAKLLPGRRAISYVASLGGTPEAGVVGSRIVTSAINAALANGMLAHADETDDNHQASYSHPGCGVVAAALAMAEREAQGGTAFLRAIVLGYDIGCRLVMTFGALPFHRSGHSSHSFVPLFGAAAAAGALAGLDARRARYLLSYAAQQASGVSCWARDAEHVEKAFDFGGMTARNGCTAAAMAAHGFTAVEDAFCGERNFFQAYAPQADPGLWVDGLGRRYEILNSNIKKWSVGTPVQAALDSLEILMREHHVGAADVARLVVRIDELGAKTVDQRNMPDINMQHLLALMLVDGTLTFASSHDLSRARDRAVMALRKRIELVEDAQMTRERPVRQAALELTTRDGRILRHHTRAVRGTTFNPMTRAEVDAKCLDLTAPVLGTRRARRLLDALWNVERLDNVGKLRRLYQPPATAATAA